MPGENLTQIEAAQRSKIVSVHSYEVDLDLTTSDETFGSKTTVKFAATAGASTFIDAITAAVRSVNLNGQELDVAKGSSPLNVHGLQFQELLPQNVHALQRWMR